MRPTLTLKKKLAPAPVDTVNPEAQPAEPVEATEQVNVKPAAPPQQAKPVKLSPQQAKEAKEARAAANRLLGQELSARRRAYSGSLQETDRKVR